MKYVNVAVDMDTWASLKRIKEESHIPLTILVRLAVEAYLKKLEADNATVA